MELTDEQKVRHGSGIQNYYYGGVSKVINLKLTTEQLKTIVDSNVFNGSVGQFIESVERIIDSHGKSE
jgi:hypothetical protein